MNLIGSKPAPTVANTSKNETSNKTMNHNKNQIIRGKS